MRFARVAEVVCDALFTELSIVDTFIDKLGLFTMDSYIQSRDQVIARQQEDMLELSAPVVTLWDGIVALPLIGTPDSARTQVRDGNIDAGDC